MPDSFRWVVEIDVDAGWVQCGFEVTEEHCKQIAAMLLPKAYLHEVVVKIARGPSPKMIEKLRKE